MMYSPLKLVDNFVLKHTDDYIINSNRPIIRYSAENILFYKDTTKNLGVFLNLTLAKRLLGIFNIYNLSKWHEHLNLML